MDPNMTLKILLEYFEGKGNYTTEEVSDAVEALSDWLHTGGFVPNLGALPESRQRTILKMFVWAVEARQKYLSV